MKDHYPRNAHLKPNLYWKEEMKGYMSDKNKSNKHKERKVK